MKTKLVALAVAGALASPVHFGFDVGVPTYNYPGSGKTLAGAQELKHDGSSAHSAGKGALVVTFGKTF